MSFCEFESKKVVICEQVIDIVKENKGSIEWLFNIALELVVVTAS